tara:strand:- start:11451 stop:14129 length:2679 start_codon:yes stop_codon:yes gene_type:complete
MVEFQEDNNPMTSGDGLFLDSLEIDMVSNPNTSRCDQFILDRPPHDSLYFSHQIEAVANYYNKVSNGNIDIQSHIVLNSENPEKGYYKLSKDMELYSYSDSHLSDLFKESLEIAKEDIELYLNDNDDLNFEDIIFTIFHAGIGQDFSFPTFDPTVYDIKSAYIEPTMFESIEYPIINGNKVSSGILLPETQNMIFFSSIEDIFYGETSYCDYQLGMTGTFSFLMGYALGLPPLFNTESGDPGVGIFGLMDYGSNNGRGIIPALPTPWTRKLMNWDSEINLTNFVSSENFVLADIMNDNIYRFDISDNEYFLLENKSNKLDNGLTLRDIVANYNGPYEEYDFPDSYSNWLDAIFSINDNENIFEVQDNIITGVSSYDLGLPESGILVWHINEPIIDLSNGINNNPYNKSIAIEEADGSLDIGFESYALFSNDDPTSGTKWDFWFKDNEAYHYANDIDFKCFNPYTYDLIDANFKSECINNDGVWKRTEIFDSYSNPNSNLNDNTKSFFSFEILDSVSNSIKIKAYYQSSIPYIDLNLNYDKILGTADQKIFYGLNDMNVQELNLINFTISAPSQLNLQTYQENEFILTDNNNISQMYSSDSVFVYIDNNNIFQEESGEIWFGNFKRNQNDEEFVYIDGNQFIFNDFEFTFEFTPSNGISIADFDKDGLDEIIYIDVDGQLVAYNGNGSLVNGFPFGDDYYGIVLVLTEKNNQTPIIVCRKSSHIEIIDLYGDIISLPSINLDSDIMLINDYLTDGLRFYDLVSEDSFFNISDLKYWVQRYNNHSHYPKSSYTHEIITYAPKDKIITSFYNYPNPIRDGETKFRFFVNENADSAIINIYNILGDLVDTIKVNDLTPYENNEFVWNATNLKSGLYFAEILCSNEQQHIIKIVIGQ